MPGASAIHFPRKSFKSLGVLGSSLGETLISALSNDTFPRTSFKRPGPQRPKKRTFSRRIGRKKDYIQIKPSLNHLITLFLLVLNLNLELDLMDMESKRATNNT